MYSLFDLYNDLMQGRRDTFQYRGVTFRLIRKVNRYVIEPAAEGADMSATSRYLSCMLDLQGSAACILEEGRHLFFDKIGNFTNPY